MVQQQNFMRLRRNERLIGVLDYLLRPRILNRDEQWKNDMPRAKEEGVSRTTNVSEMQLHMFAVELAISPFVLCLHHSDRSRAQWKRHRYSRHRCFPPIRTVKKSLRQTRHRHPNYQ